MPFCIEVVSVNYIWRLHCAPIMRTVSKKSRGEEASRAYSGAKCSFMKHWCSVTANCFVNVSAYTESIMNLQKHPVCDNLISIIICGYSIHCLHKYFFCQSMTFETYWFQYLPQWTNVSLKFQFCLMFDKTVIFLAIFFGWRVQPSGINPLYALTLQIISIIILNKYCLKCTLQKQQNCLLLNNIFTTVMLCACLNILSNLVKSDTLKSLYNNLKNANAKLLSIYIKM